MTDDSGILIVNLSGGLGNQMFQYACGWALARDLGLNLKVATDMLDKHSTKRRLELDRAFSTSLSVAKPRELRRILGPWRASPSIRRWLESPRFSYLRGPRYYVEHPPPPHPKARPPADYGLYLQGYWQSASYFETYSDDLRDLYSFKHIPSGKNAELVQSIREGPSASLHIRRGDYASCKKTRSFHGLCTPEYYHRAIEHLRSRIPKVRLFAFSDDPAWVNEHLGDRYPDMTVVSHNKAEAGHHDMQLMSLCNHNITANSSFSWWGAWLNQADDKIVIAPKKWFARETGMSNIVPPDWLRF